jgi:hypothetical protein
MTYSLGPGVQIHASQNREDIEHPEQSVECVDENRDLASNDNDSYQGTASAVPQTRANKDGALAPELVSG